MIVTAIPVTYKPLATTASSETAAPPISMTGKRAVTRKAAEADYDRDAHGSNDNYHKSDQVSIFLQ